MEKSLNRKDRYFRYFMHTVLGLVLIGLSFDIIMVVLTLTNNEKMLKTILDSVNKFI